MKKIWMVVCLMLVFSMMVSTAAFAAPACSVCGKTMFLECLNTTSYNANPVACPNDSTCQYTNVYYVTYWVCDTAGCKPVSSGMTHVHKQLHTKCPDNHWMCPYLY